MTEPAPGLWGGVPKAEGDSRMFAKVNMNVHTGSAHAHTHVCTQHTRPFDSLLDCFLSPVSLSPVALKLPVMKSI